MPTCKVNTHEKCLKVKKVKTFYMTLFGGENKGYESGVGDVKKMGRGGCQEGGERRLKEIASQEFRSWDDI